MTNIELEAKSLELDIRTEILLRDWKTNYKLDILPIISKALQRVAQGGFKMNPRPVTETTYKQGLLKAASILEAEAKFQKEQSCEKEWIILLEQARVLMEEAND